MSDEWRTATLAEVADVIGGGTPSTKEPAYWGGEVIWLTPTEVVRADGQVIQTSERTITEKGLEKSSAKLLPAGTVLVTSRASVGFTAIAGVPLSTNQGFQSLVPRVSLLPEFLMMWVQANRDAFRNRAGGSTFPEVSKAKVKSIAISIPPLVAQRRIVDMVGATDAHIAAIETQEKSAARLLTSLRDHLLSTDGYWEECELGEVARLRIGRTPRRNDERYWTDDLEHPFMTIADMSSWYVGKAREGVTDLAIRQGQAKSVPAGSLLMSFKLSIGRVGITDREVFPNEAIVWVAPQPRCDRDFLAHWLASKDLTGDTVRAVKGATLNSKSLAAIPVAFPDIARQNEIRDILEQQRQLVEAIESEVESLRGMRSRLLADLLSQAASLPESYDTLLSEVAG